MDTTVEDLIKYLNLEVLVKGKENGAITVADINRPGLQFFGFYNYFAKERIQVVGKAEWSFLDSMPKELRDQRLKTFFEYDFPCAIITRDLIPHSEFIGNAAKYNRWVLRSDTITTRLINKIMNYLDEKLSPETRLHGVLVDVYGIGILITGESGVGKSETALELIKRGHRLVADDAVDIKAIDRILYGTPPYITEGMMEVRGMGIIDVPALYGLSSITRRKVIDLEVQLKQWDDKIEFDRLGLDEEYTKILGIPLRKLCIPIRPGRNLAVLIEAAAANYRYSLVSKVRPVETIENRMDEIAKKSGDNNG